MSQEIIFTTLPHFRETVEGKDYLRLSVYVTVRLHPASETTLKAFPDVLAWPEKILEGEYGFRQLNGSVLEAELLTGKIDPELFGHILHDQIRVKGFEQEDLTAKRIISMPITHIRDFLFDNYRKIGIENPKNLVSADKFLDPERFGKISRIQINEQALNQAETGQFRKTIQAKEFLRRDDSADQQIRMQVRRDKFRKFQMAASPKEDFAQLRQFHRVDTPARPPSHLILKKPQFEFHDIVSVASGYPQMMRRLGFVLDFRIPFTSAIPGTGTLALETGGMDFFTEGTVLSSPPTAYGITAKGFYVADRNNAIFKNGFVRINTPSFDVIQVDADGAAIKASILAEAKAQDVARFYEVRSGLMMSRNSEEKPVAEPDPPADEGLPFLRSSGIAIVKKGMAEHLFQKFETSLKLPAKLMDMSRAAQSAPLRAVLTPGAPGAHTRVVRPAATPSRQLNLALNPVLFQKIIPTETLYSDDVVQGYRMDIAYEETPGKWYSLHRRKNEYTWYDDANNPHPMAEEEPDEGYIELGMTENPDDKEEVFIPETMARWEGWSLSVTRPGYAINEADDDPEPKAVKRDFVNKSKAVEMKKYAFDPDLEFRMNVVSKAEPGTLPRLRFGKDYRIRIRTVDLAGNSVALEQQTESAADTIRTNIRYMRYEPLASPIILAGNPLRDGEFLKTMVIRSNYDTPAGEYERTHTGAGSFPGFARRYLLPPKNSQQVAENHGMFEKAMGNNPDAAKTIYGLITSHEGLYKRPSETVEKIYQPSEVEVIYLPDPMAAGVALFLADNTEQTHDQDFKPRMFGFFTNQELSPAQTNGKIPEDWYRAQPLTIRLEEGEPDASWGTDRVLTIRLPKGHRMRLRYSSFWREEDFKQLSAIWEIITAGKPANQAELEQLARSGQHWMISPPEEIELVHAVQQPVEAPEITALLPDRDFGQTFAFIHTRFKVHGESTEKAEFQAKWTEPYDDGIAVKIDYTRPGRNSIPDIEVQYNDEILTRGTIPEPQKIPPHLQIKDRAVIRPVPVFRLETRPKAEFEKEPQPAALRINRVFEAQNKSYKNMVQEKSVSPKTMVNRVRFDLLEPRFNFLKLINFRINPLKHNFGDTRHRWVDYKLIATTRYREYFDKILKNDKTLLITRESAWWERVNILSSARPALPEIDYVIPTFEWRKTQSVDAVRHRRMGGGLRIYLNRPWFSTGEDEMLAVVLPGKSSLPTTLTMVARQSYTDLFTHWAMDPLLFSVPPENLSPKPEDFRMNPVVDENLQYPGPANARANVAAYPVRFDPDRQQWYCDLAIDPGAMYFPFVKLALARYQPYSVKKETEDVCLSPVVFSTFIQLIPERQTTLRFTKDDQNSRFSVTVEGTIYNERMSATFGNRSMLRISFLDSRIAQPIYGFVDNGSNEKKLEDEGFETAITQTNVTGNRFSITKEFRLPRDYKTAPFQVIIEEYERGPVKIPGLDKVYEERLGQSEETDRLIYADVIKINEVKK